MKKKSIKNIAIFLLFTFAVNGVSNSNLALARTAEPQILKPDSADLKIPSQLGRLEEIQKFENSKKTIILIEDAHAVADAQFSIKKILGELFQQGIRLTALEGVSGDLDALLFRTFPEREILAEAIEDYVARGELSGAAAAAILNPEEMKFTGAEDAALYEEAIDLFLAAQNQSGAFKTEVTALEERLRVLQKKFNSEKASRLLEHLRAFEFEPEKNTAVFLELEKIKKPSAERHPHLVAVFEELKNKEIRNIEALEKEADFLSAQFLKQAGDPVKILLLNQHAQDYKTGQGSFSAFASFLLASAHEEGLQLEPSLPLKEQVRLYEMLESMRGREFFKEFENYAAELKTIVFKSGEERALDILDEKISVLKRFSDLELSREQWAGLADFKKEIVAAARQTALPVRDFAEKVLSETEKIFAEFKNHRKFYRNAEFREKAMLKKTLTALQKGGQNRAILVSGGFHTQGFLDLLKREKISCFLITPAIYHLPAENIYKDGMRGQVSWKSYFRPVDGKIDLYDAFARAAAEKTTRIFEEKRKTPAAEILKKWRDNILIRLAAEGRLAETKNYTTYVDRLIFRTGNSGEKARILREWKKTVNAFLERIEDLKNRGSLTPKNLVGWKPVANVPGWSQTPLQQNGPGRWGNARWTINRQPEPVVKSLSAPAGKRSELRVDNITPPNGSPVQSLSSEVPGKRRPVMPLRLRILMPILQFFYFITTFFVKKEIRGIENIVRGENGIFIFNHMTLWDGLLIANEVYNKTGRLMLFLADSRYIDPLQKFLVWFGAGIMIEFDENGEPKKGAQAAKLKQAVLEGWDIGIFPTGRINAPFRFLKDWKLTFASIASETNRPIYPGIITGTRPRVLSIRTLIEMFWSFFIYGRRADVAIEIGQPRSSEGKTTVDIVVEQQQSLAGMLTGKVVQGKPVADDLYAGLPEEQEKFRAKHKADTPRGEQRVEASQRSELREGKAVDYAGLKGLELVKNATVISLQMEMGYSRGFLEVVEKKFGKKIADQVSQATLTGGLGALMHDLFPSWKANGLDIIGIHPIWEEIKKKPYPEGPLNLGRYQREVMEAAMAERGESPIVFSIDLDWDEDYNRYAQENEKARAAFGRKVFIRALKEYTSQYGAPNYHLDAYYLKDETKPDTEENRQRVFDTVYSDDHPAWRDYHLAVYARASEQLVKILKSQGVVKDNTVEIHNEVFASIPKKEADPKRTLVHINHSAYLPTIYSPNVRSYGLLGFPAWMRQYVVKDGGNSISLVDYAALNYDLVTGVAIDEHYWVLRRNIFRNAGRRLDHYNDGEIRSTNGVLTEHWQSLALQELIEHYRIQLGLPEKVDSAVFYKTLEADPELREEFITRQEFIKAAEAANFLGWMADIQEQSAWLEKALHQSGKTREDFTGFFNQVETAARSNDSEAWNAIKNEHAKLRDILLSYPMVSNVRRQVPYKGPEKWLEVLQSFNDPKKLKDFKKTKIRVIIGGRTFSDQADGEFQAMQALVKALELQDHFAFIKDYNVFDAAIMFRAMAGVVMLSDEFLEASATSMMKGVVNGAALIGVWGGAMPELFKLIDEKGGVVDIFKKKTPHDLVVKNLKRGRWKIVNGALVSYSQERSYQAGGGRRPHAQALADSLMWLHDQYAEPSKRRAILWQSVSGTPKVDMREGQARAHMQIIERVLAEKKRREALFASLRFDAESLKTFLDNSSNAFIWRHHEGEDGIFHTGRTSQTGLLGLVNMFREISTYGSGDQRGKFSIEAVEHHARRGDLFSYLLDVLKAAPESLRPFTDEIKQLANEASSIPKNLQALKEDPDLEGEYLIQLNRLNSLNIEALELIEKLGLWIAGQTFEKYLIQASQKESQALLEPIFLNRFIRKYLSRYLDQRPGTFPLYTKDTLIRAYGFMHEGQPHLFGVNLGADPTFGSRQSKAYTDISNDESFQRFLTLFLEEGKGVYQVINAASGERYAHYDLKKDNFIISLGLPAPEGIQLLRLDSKSIEVANLLVSARPESFDTQNLQRVITGWKEKIKKAETEDRQAVLDQELRYFSDLSPEVARQTFGKFLPRMMALIAVLSPSALDKIKGWDLMVYASLKKVTAQNEELFLNGEVGFHLTSREQTVVVSRVIRAGQNFSAQNIIFAIEFSEEPVNLGDGKVGSRVLELSPIRLEPTHQYDVFNVLNGIAYQAVHTGTDLLNGWPIRIPVRDHYDRGEKVRHGWGFDVYQIRSVTPRPDLLREQEPVEPVENLILALNVLDLGARFDNGTRSVTTQGGLENAGQIERNLRLFGFGGVYPYALFKTGRISTELHSVPTAGLYWIGDTSDGSLPRVLVSVRGYETKKDDNLSDNKGNAFSIPNNSTVDPRHVSAGVDPSSFLRNLNVRFQEKRIRSFFDFIFWRSPESVNEKNYKQYFYRELTQYEQADWDDAGTDEEKLKVMKQLTREGGHFAVRINEGGKERLILVKHLFNEPGRDQAVRNPFHPDVIAQTKEEIKWAIDHGASGIRIDLAHKLLNSELKTMINTWAEEGFLTDPAGAYRADYQPLQDLIEYGKRYMENLEEFLAPVIAKKEKTGFFVIAEAYMNYHHDQLRSLGVDAVYYESPHKDYMRLASGAPEIKARNLAGAVARTFVERDLFVFPSNFDVDPLKEVGGSREAFLLLMVILAKLGVPVMIDVRELMDQHGQLIPIPGRNHPFPSPDEIQKRRDSDHYRGQFEQSHYGKMIRDFLRLLNGRKLKSVKILDNQNRDQFISLDLEFEEGADNQTHKDHLLIILNMKPSQDAIVWSESGFAKDVSGTSGAVDLQTGEVFRVFEDKVHALVFPANIQYRILARKPAAVDDAAMPRSELRFVQKTAQEVISYVAQQRPIPSGLAAKVVLAGKSSNFIDQVNEAAKDPDMIETYGAFLISEGGTQRIKSFYEKNPDYEKTLEVFWSNKIEEMRSAAQAHLFSNPDDSLNFAFAMPVPESPKLRGWFLNYVQMISSLRAEYPSRVHGAIRLLATSSQIHGADLKDFWREVGRTGIVKPIEMGTSSTTYQLDSYLNDKQNGNALIYGFENLTIEPKNKKRLVRASRDVNAETVFTVAGLLTFELAPERGVLAEATLRRIPDILPGVTYSSDGLQIQHSAMRLVYQQLRVGRMFAVSA